VVVFRSRFFSKKGSDANIYGQKPSRELLEKQYSVQRIPWQQKGKESYETENKGCYKKQSLDRNGSKVSKMVQSISISPKSEWRLSAGSGHEGSESIHETDSLQDGRNPNIGTTFNEK
jgi:hypothetical protein